MAAKNGTAHGVGLANSAAHANNIFAFQQQRKDHLMAHKMMKHSYDMRASDLQRYASPRVNQGHGI